MAAPVNRAKGQTLRHPPRGFIWVHIDRIDKRGDDVWAVQHWEGKKAYYSTVHEVRWYVPSKTIFQRYRGQPKAVIVCRGRLSYDVVNDAFIIYPASIEEKT